MSKWFNCMTDTAKVCQAWGPHPSLPSFRSWYLPSATKFHVYLYSAIFKSTCPGGWFWNGVGALNTMLLIPGNIGSNEPETSSPEGLAQLQLNAVPWLITDNLIRTRKGLDKCCLRWSVSFPCYWRKLVGVWWCPRWAPALWSRNYAAQVVAVPRRVQGHSADYHKSQDNGRTGLRFGSLKIRQDW